MLTRLQACFLALTIGAVAANSADRPQIDGPAIILKNITQQVKQFKKDHPNEYLRVEENLKSSFLNDISTQLEVTPSVEISSPFEFIVISTFADLFSQKEPAQITNVLESYNNQLTVLIGQALQSAAPQQIETPTPVQATETPVVAPTQTEPKAEDLVALFTNVVEQVKAAKTEAPEVEVELTKALVAEMQQADSSLPTPEEGKSFDDVMKSSLDFFQRKYKQEVVGHVLPALKRFNDNFPAHKEKALREAERIKQQLTKVYEQSAPRVEKALNTGLKSIKKKFRF